MACLIKNTDQGVKVVTQNGNRSVLFDAIAGIPVLNNIEKAIDAYSSIFSAKFKSTFGDWQNRTAINPAVVQQVSDQYDALFPDQSLSEDKQVLIGVANRMNNPIMVSPVNINEDYTIEGKAYYTTELDPSAGVFIYDEVESEDIVIDQIPEGQDTPTFETDTIKASSSNVINFTTSSGNNYKVIDATKEISNIDNVELNINVNGITYDNGEPRLFFRNIKGQVFNNYEEALQNTDTGTIEAGFLNGTFERVNDLNVVSNSDILIQGDNYILNNPDSFMKIIDISYNTNPKTVDGYVNYMIKSGYISGTKVRYNDQYFYMGAGNLAARKMHNSVRSVADARLNLIDKAEITLFEDGRFSITEINQDNLNVIDSAGNETTISKSELKQMVNEGRYNEIASQYQHAPILVADMYIEDNDIFRQDNSQIVQDAVEKREQQKMSILNVLESLGVSVIGMTDYLAKYATKTGHDPSVRALADLANRVIALAENATEADLTEEAAHFLVESYVNQGEVNDALSMVDQSVEWEQEAGKYYDIYSEIYQDEELETAIRKEILGKMLANEFQRTFQDAQTNQSTNTLLTLFNNIIQSIRSFLGNQRSTLNKIVQNIADSALSEDANAFNTELLDMSNFTLYSADAKRTNEFLNNKRRLLEAQLRNLRRSSSSFAGRAKADIDAIKRELERLGTALDDNVVETTINAFVSTTEAQADFVGNIISSARENRRDDGKLTLSLQDWQNLNNVNVIMLPLVRELRQFVNNETNLDRDSRRRIVENIDKTIIKVEQLNEDVRAIQERDNQSFITKFFAEVGRMTDSDLTYVTNYLNNIVKDITWISSKLGTLEHSKNPILSVLPTLISRVYRNANTSTQGQTKEFLQTVETGSWNISKFERLLQKDKNGRYTSFLLNDIDMPKAYEDYKRKQIEGLQAAFPELANKTIDQLYKESEDGGFEITTTEGKVRFRADVNGARLGFMNAEQRTAFNNVMNPFLSENSERRYTQAYYDQVNSIYEEAAKLRPDGSDRAISDEAISISKSFGSRRYNIKKPFMDRNGKVDWLRLRQDPNASYALNQINREKQNLKNPLYTDGSPKTGRDLNVSEDLTAIDEAWKKRFEKKGKQTVNTEFFDQLASVEREEGSEAAYNFLVANSRISFNNEFFDSLSQSYLDIGQEVFEEDNELSTNDKYILQDALENIASLRTQIQGILRRNRDTLNLGNIDAGMQTNDMDTIRQLQSELLPYQEIVRKAIAITEKPFPNSEVSEYEMNDFFWNSFRDSRYNQGYEFILNNHATDENQRQIRAFKYRLDSYSGANFPNFSPGERSFIARKLGFPEDIDRNEFKQLFYERVGTSISIRLDLLNSFARSKALPYFRRFAPKGYTQTVEDLKAGRVRVTDFAQDILNGIKNRTPVSQYVDIEVQDDWNEEGSTFDQYINPNYVEQSPLGHFQPKKSIYQNKLYKNHFGVGEDGIATRNLEEWTMIQTLVDLKRQGLDNYDESGTSHNLYEIPQISKTTLSKFMSTNTPLNESIINLYRDALTNRVDDPLYGQKEDLELAGIDESKFRLIPKYYIRTLEEQSDVEHDLARSYTMFLLQSNMYKERSNSINTVMSLEQNLLSLKYEGGKSPETTNAYQTFKEHVDAHWYGVRQNERLEIPGINGGKIDLTKLAIGYDKFTRLMNLGFSPIIAATAFTTGQFNLLVEKKVGQYITSESVNYGNKEVTKLSSGYVSEIGDIDRNNRLYVLGERMGIFNISERVHSAGYNKIIRTVGNNLPYKLMEILSFPLAPQTMIAVMDDTRLYNGQFYRYNQYKKLPENSGLNKKQIKRNWEALRNDSLYNIMNVSEGEITYREGVDPALVDRQIAIAQREITSLNQIADAVISPEDKSSASRNYMFNFMLAHRGWFQLNAQRRWKHKGFNFSTGLMEEGTYRTSFQYLKNIKNNLSEKGLTNIFNALREEYHQLEDYEKTNIARTMVDLGVFMIGMALMPIFAGLSDDDDNKENWIAQFTAFVGLRTINEMYSQLPIMIEKEGIEMLQSPFVMARKLGELTTLSNYDFWSEIESGPYKGESRLWSLLMKQTWGKQYYQLKSTEDIKRTSDYFRLMNNSTLFLGQKGKSE